MRTAAYTVGQTFTAQPAARVLADQVFSSIDSVHGIGDLTRLVFDHTFLPDGLRGQFDPHSRTVTVSTKAHYPLTNGAHEVGHAVDAVFLVHASGLGRLDGPITHYASEYAYGFAQGLLVGWFAAVRNSLLIHEWMQAKQRVPFGSANYQTAQYYLEAAEMWARSYEQFIAQQTRNISFRSEFDDKRKQTKVTAGGRLRVYWRQKEFVPIADEMTRVFHGLGWM